MMTEWAEAEWRSLGGCVASLMGSDSETVSMSREEIYRSIEDLCVEGFAATVYDRVARAMFAAAESKAKQLSSLAQTESFSSAMASAWRAHASQTRSAAAVCLYLDRSYAQKRAVGLREAGSLAFRRALLAEPGLSVAVAASVREVAEAHRSRKEEEEEVNISAAKDCCDMLSELRLYEEILEPHLLRDARDFYAAEGRRLSTTGDASSDAAAYATLALKTLERADEAIDLFLPERTRPLLRAAVEDHLVAPHAARVFSASFATLVDAKDDETLGDLYGLLRLVGAADLAKKTVESLAVDRATEILRSSTTEVFEKLKDDKVRVPDDKVLVKELLSLHRRLATLCATRFSGESSSSKKKKIKSWGPGTLKDAFEEAVNEDENAARFAEILAAYFASAVATTTDATGRLEGAMLLFRFSRSKDIFEAFFRRDLANRLLISRSSSPSTSTSSPSGGSEKSSLLENERLAIGLLEKECGAAYVSKLDGMCNDLDLAKTLAADYLRDGATKETSVALVPLVLTTGYWPSYPASTLLLPAALETAKQKFETYYAAKFQGRRLHWHTELGRCIVRGTFHSSKKKTYQFDATPLQAAVLCCFDDAPTLSLSQLLARTGLDSLDAVLGSLKGLLLEDKDLIRINRSFQSKSVLVKLPNPATAAIAVSPEARAKIVGAVSRDRQYAIDAAIVRVMKARKTLPHQQLLADVLARLKHPATAADIKLRIESLIEREYLERDDNGASYYNYLA